jgi:hypothetical protein
MVFLKVLFKDFPDDILKDAWVREYMERPNDILHWNVQFFRPVHDWELEVTQKIRCGGEDKNLLDSV